MKEFPRKFLSLRDKNGLHRRSKSVPPGHKDKQHTHSGSSFRAMFRMDASKEAIKSDDDMKQIEPAKIEETRRRLEELNIQDVGDDYIRNILETNIADSDPTKTADFISLEQKAAAGIITSYDPSVHLLGAENREAVTCYLDALLFAMFAKLDAFECMLRSDFPADDPKSKLVTLLRIWVNLLRSGKLIRTDLTKLLQDTLGDCGWPDARLLEQQDTSEAFAFLTETLQLPLLSLQVDLFHQGKKDKDDHKVVYERLLNLAVPPDSDGKGIKLEDCLEEYFNTTVDVLRDHEEAKKGSIDESARDGSATPSQPNAIRLIRGDDDIGASSVTTSPIALTASHQSFENAIARTESQASTNSGHYDRIPSQSGPSQENESARASPNALRTRSASVIQRIVLDERGRATPVEASEAGEEPKKARRKGSTIVKAVTIPAWQFFRLIPWHAVTSSEPRNDTEVALNFDQRPVVGICLKRYAMTNSGEASRHNTYIDIPDSLRLPHFMFAGGPQLDQDPTGLSAEYKLVLQSVVCHRGESLQSGHYIAFARVAPKLLTGNRRHDFDPPPDYEEAQWVKFDDLEEDNERVTYVDNIKEALRQEMPYLLFYQIVPMCEMPRASMDGTQEGPPSYNDSFNGSFNGSKTSFELMGTSFSNDGSTASTRLTSNYREELQATEKAYRSKPPSIRLSGEIDPGETPQRINFDRAWAASHTGSTPGGSRRESVALTESPAATPGASSPVISPSDEGTASRLSRAASRFALGKQSRPTSQSGEGRLSFSMTRLGGLMKSSKESAATDSNGLNVPTANLTGPSGADASHRAPESPIDGEKPTATPHGGGQKTKPRGDKRQGKEKSRGKDRDKEKSDKVKSEEQPERECSVM